MFEKLLIFAALLLIHVDLHSCVYPHKRFKYEENLSGDSANKNAVVAPGSKHESDGKSSWASEVKTSSEMSSAGKWRELKGDAIPLGKCRLSRNLYTLLVDNSECSTKCYYKYKNPWIGSCYGGNCQCKNPKTGEFKYL